MSVPLEVRLRLPNGEERIVTRELADLSFGAKARGGYATAEAPLERPLSLPAVDEFSQLTVTDRRSAEVVWDGRLLTPGRDVSESGQTADLTGVGEGPASMKDQTIPYMAIDSSLASWEEQTSTKKDLSVRTGSAPGSEAPGLTFTARGNVAAGDQSIAWFRNLHLCGQRIGAIAFTHAEGETGTHALDLRIGDTPESPSAVLFTYPWAVAGATRFVAFTPSSWPNASTFKFAWRFLGGGAVSDGGWGTIRSVSAIARMLGRDRQPLLPAAYSPNGLRLETVFTDVIARFCPRLDIENATIAPGSFDFTQLVWPSGINPEQILDELLDMEPDFTWAVWERQSNGRYRTELTTLPTEVRYEASAVDGWSSPNPSSETYDRVIVLWKDSAAREQSMTVTGSAPSLQAAGLSRTATISLGSEVGTAAQANQAGNAFLADHRVPPSGGQLTIARPILDRKNGRYVMPWEIRPAELIRVVGVHSQPDALNATSPDGVTVARIAEMNFRLSSMRAVLDLDVPAMTEQRVLVQLVNARSRR